MAQDLELRIRISADGRAAIEGTREVERSMERMGDTAQTVGKLIAGYLSFEFAKTAVQELFTVQARLQDLQAQFKALAGDQAAAQFAYVQEAAQRLSMDLDGARDAYGKMLVMVDAGLLNINQAQQMFEGLASYARLAGSSAEAVGLSMYGLSQALGQGRVQMTELLQITEPLPGSLNKIAEAAKMTTGELRAMVMDPGGTGVSSAQLRDWVIKAFGDAIPVAESMAGNLSATWTRVKNDWRLFLEDMGSSSGFADIAKTALDGFSALLTGLDSPQFTQVARNFTSLFSSALNELFGVFRLLMDHIEELVTVYLGVKFVQAMTVVIKAVEAYKTTVAAMMAQTTMYMTASQAAAIGLGAAIKASMVLIAPVLTIAVGAYLLLADNTDHAAEAQDSYNRVLQQTGGSLDELAKKYKALTEAQKQSTAIQLSLELKKQQDAIWKQRGEIEAELSKLRTEIVVGSTGSLKANEARLNSFGYQQAADGDADALLNLITKIKAAQTAGEDLNTTVSSGTFGQKDLLDTLGKLAIDYKKSADGIAFTDDALKLLNGELPNTAKGFQAAGEAAKRAGKDFYDALNKDWEKLATIGMNNAELAQYTATTQGASAGQTQLAVSTGALKDQIESLQTALKSGNPELITQAENALRGAAANAIAAKGADAFSQSMAKLGQSGTLSMRDMVRESERAQQEAEKIGAAQLNVNEMIARAEREVREGRIQGANESLQTAQKAQQASQQILTAYQQEGQAAGELAEMQAKAAAAAEKYPERYQAVYDATLMQLMADQDLAAGKKTIIDAEEKHQRTLAETTKYQTEQAQATQALTQQEALRAEQLGLLQSMLQLVASNSRAVFDAFVPGGQQPIFTATISSAQEAYSAVQRYGDVMQDVLKKQQELAAQGVDLNTINWDEYAKRINAGMDQESLKNIQQATKGLESHNAELLSGLALLTQNATSYSDLAVKQDVATLSLENFVSAGDKEKAVLMGMYEEARKYQAGLELLTDVLGKGKDAFDAMRGPLGKYEDAMQKASAAEKLLADPQYIKQLEKAGVSLEQAQDYIAAYRMEVEKTVSATAQAFEDLAGSIYGEWTNMFESLFQGNLNSFADFADSVKDLFLKMLAQMAAAALAKPILVPVLQMVGGAMGLEGGMTNSILNNVIPGLNLGGTGGASGGGLGSITDLLGLGNLFGGGGSMVNGAASFAAGLGGIAGAGSMVAGASSFAAGIGAAWTGASALGAAGGAMAGIGTAMTAISAAIPVIGTVIAVVSMLSSLFDDEPNPHAYVQSGKDDLWASGREGTIRQGASGMDYGYVFGDVEEEDAIKMRDAFLEMDKALTAVIPTVDLAGVKMGAFGASGGGYIAAINGVETAVGSMDEATSAFVQEWVKRAADVGATSRLVSDALYQMTGSADELIAAFAVMQGMDAAGNLNQQIIDIARAADAGKASLVDTLTALASIQGYIVADPLGDFEDALADSLKTTFDRLGEAGTALADGMAKVDWTESASLQELSGLIQSRYALEAQMIQEIQGYLEGVTASFGSSIEEIQLSVMDNAQKYDYYSQQAQAAAETLKTATDPADIAKLAEDARAAAMSAYGLLDESQKGAVSAEFISFLEATQQTATDQLNAAQQTVLDQHQATADLLADALINAGQAAASAIEAAAAAVAAAAQSQENNLANIWSGLNEALSKNGMAAGGIVGGTWNGQAGISGDTVATMLTPGEAVISRAQTQKHAALIKAIMADEVRYAAGGLPPYPGSSGSGGSGDSGDSGSGSTSEVDWTGQRRYATQGGTMFDPDKINVSPWGNSVSIDNATYLNPLLDAIDRLAEAQKNPDTLFGDLATTLLTELEASKTSSESAKGAVASRDALLWEKALRSEYAGKYDALMAEADQKQQALLDQKASGAMNGEEYWQLQTGTRQLYADKASDLVLEFNKTLEAGAGAAEDNTQALDDLVQHYQDILDNTTQFAAALRDLGRETEDSIKQATDWGATEAQLTVIREGAAKQEQLLREEYAQQLSDLMQPYQDAIAGGTEFSAALRDMARQTEDALEQAYQLGATEDDLARIRAGAAAQEQDLRDQYARQLNDLLQPYQDAIDNTSAFDQQLRDLARQTEDAIEQATQLGASTDDLATITEGAAAMEKKLRDERAQQLTDFMRGFTGTDGVSQFANALYDLNRQLTDNLQTATDLGATEEQLAQIREWTADQAVKAAEAAVQQEIDTYQQAADAVVETLARITDAITQLRDSVNVDLLTLQRAHPNWDETGYQQQRVADLQAQLASADSLSLEARMELAEELRGAIMDRYAAEMGAIEEQRAALENMISLAKNLKQWLDSLKLSDLSTLSPEQKLAEAQQQYQDTLRNAMGGDADAQGQLQGAAEAYLSEARAYFASTEAYGGIFSQVTATLEGLASAWQTQGEGGLAGLDEQLTAYEQQALDLADAATQELNALLPLLEQWQAEAQRQANSELAALQATLNTNTTAIIKALQDSGLVTGQKLESALASLTAAISAALASVASKVATTSNPVGGAGAFELNGHMTGGVMPGPSTGGSSGFNEAYYLATNPDVAAAVASGGYSSGYDHYATIGSYEGRAPTYADGGLASGWSLVGEEGPELVNFTMPGRVYTAADTRLMLAENDSGEDSEAVVTELKALIRLQSEANRQLIQKLDAVESRLAGIESKARLEAAA